MITINLLPLEMRQKRRTPLKLMAGVAASVAINGCLFAYWAWTAFGVAAEVKSELALLSDTQASLAPQVEHHKALENESQVFQSREKMLERITQTRVSWTQELDLLTDTINVGGDGEKYLIWMDDLTVDMKENKRRESYGMMKAAGHSGSADFSHVANFFDDIEGSKLMTHFKKPKSPEGQLENEDPDLQPSIVFSFPLELDLRDPKERHASVEVSGGESK